MRGLDSTLLKGKALLKNLNNAELSESFAQLGIPKYRSSQILDAVFNSSAQDFEDISTLPKDLRANLGERFVFNSLTLERVQQSSDGTLKFLFSMIDGAKIESVLITSDTLDDEKNPRRRTLCISTQAGCPLACEFCATATLKLQRNLECAEIIDQFLSVKRHSGFEITNIVFMGMGEPMLNYDNVFRAVDRFTDPKLGALSAKRITLSTAGVVPGILRMADEKRTVKLAISLHATTNGLRTKLMPIARKHSLEELGNAIEYYYRCTKIPLTYEYIVFAGLNDSDADVQRLAKMCRRVPSKVNVIPFHSIEFTHPEGMATTLKAPSPQNFKLFVSKLKSAGVRAMVRSSSGLDIDAACGQLALSNEDSLT